jgi:hypothetical protein
VKTPRIIFKVLNFECIISKSIVFTSFFYSHPSELNEILSFAKKNNSDFLIGKIGGRLIFGRIRYLRWNMI